MKTFSTILVLLISIGLYAQVTNVATLFHDKGMPNGHFAIQFHTNQMPTADNCVKGNHPIDAQANTLMQNVFLAHDCGIDEDTNYKQKVMVPDTTGGWVYFKIRLKDITKKIEYSYNNQSYPDSLVFKYYNATKGKWKNMKSIFRPKHYIPDNLAYHDTIHGTQDALRIRYKVKGAKKKKKHNKSVGISAQEISKISLEKYTYSDRIVIKVSSVQKGTYRVIDLSGRVLKTSSYRNAEITIERSLSKGMVYVIINNEREQIVEKIIL